METNSWWQLHHSLQINTIRNSTLLLLLLLQRSVVERNNHTKLYLFSRSIYRPTISSPWDLFRLRRRKGIFWGAYFPLISINLVGKQFLRKIKNKLFDVLMDAQPGVINLVSSVHAPKLDWMSNAVLSPNWCCYSFLLSMWSTPLSLHGKRLNHEAKRRPVPSQGRFMYDNGRTLTTKLLNLHST